ncbi:MAG TPA: 3-deoxy-manno-octulosonate cytidylyltransferase [Woeseiaceae bacterium]|nr:3-deoxy-manno-octulosonate cytidylyltransferase [Woeseiaceae bacterium]
MSGFVVVIPARYASERLPGKPLRLIAGRTMIEHVYACARASEADETIIATDDRRIADAARRFGADVCMTSGHHNSGTERLAEVCSERRWAGTQRVINLQGDEPLMPPELINQCAELLEDPDVDVSTLASPLRSEADFRSPNVVKVVRSEIGDALYFSRAAIPHARETVNTALAMESALHHHGIYGYRAAILQRLVAAQASPLEVCERLEQLRALSLGMTIRVGLPGRRPGPGVDTEADLLAVEAHMGKVQQ